MLLFLPDGSIEHSRAQVGVGTLIVFIAMVLVAAISAGVLLNTAGFLQTQGADTGTDSTEQAADTLNVITEVGTLEPDNGIDEIRVGVQPAAGASDIVLSDITIQWVGEKTFANIVVGVGDDGTRANGSTNPEEIVLTDSEANFVIDVVSAESENDIVMTESSDRYELIVPLSETADNWEGLATTEITGETVDQDVDGNDIFNQGDRFVLDETPIDSFGVVEIIDDDGALLALAQGSDIFRIVDADAGIVEFDNDPTLDSDDVDEFVVDYEVIDTDAVSQPGLSSLTPGEEVRLTITTEDGAQTVDIIQVPDPLTGKNNTVTL